MVPAFAEDRATLGSCLAAIAIAEAHDNEWQEPEFTPDECAVIAGKAIDSGYVLINPKSSKDEIDRAIRNLNVGPPKSTLSAAPAIDLAPKIKIPGGVGSHRNGGTSYRWEYPDYSQDAPGYWSEYSTGERFFHHYPDRVGTAPSER